MRTVHRNWADLAAAATAWHTGDPAAAFVFGAEDTLYADSHRVDDVALLALQLTTPPKGSR
ncbi:hypothetical protein [Streptomyces sp. NPDC000880]